MADEKLINQEAGKESKYSRRNKRTEHERNVQAGESGTTSPEPNPQAKNRKTLMESWHRDNIGGKAEGFVHYETPREVEALIVGGKLYLWQRELPTHPGEKVLTFPDREDTSHIRDQEMAPASSGYGNTKYHDLRTDVYERTVDHVDFTEDEAMIIDVSKADMIDEAVAQLVGKTDVLVDPAVLSYLYRKKRELSGKKVMHRINTLPKPADGVVQREMDEETDNWFDFTEVTDKRTGEILEHVKSGAETIGIAFVGPGRVALMREKAPAMGYVASTIATGGGWNPNKNPYSGERGSEVWSAERNFLKEVHEELGRAPVGGAEVHQVARFAPNPDSLTTVTVGFILGGSEYRGLSETGDEITKIAPLICTLEELGDLVDSGDIIDDRTVGLIYMAELAQRNHPEWITGGRRD